MASLVNVLVLPETCFLLSDLSLLSSGVRSAKCTYSEDLALS